MVDFMIMGVMGVAKPLSLSLSFTWPRYAHNTHKINEKQIGEDIKVLKSWMLP